MTSQTKQCLQTFGNLQNCLTKGTFLNRFHLSVSKSNDSFMRPEGTEKFGPGRTGPTLDGGPEQILAVTAFQLLTGQLSKQVVRTLYVPFQILAILGPVP